MSELPRRPIEPRDPQYEVDGLTGVLSRRALVAQLAERAERARRDAAGIALCLVDLDRFKNFNLSHGPSCGDDALRDIAQRLVRTMCEERAGTLIARYDGAVFAALVETDSDHRLAAAAEALRRAVAAARSPSGARLSASIGAVRARIGERVDSLLVRAEQTLHLAKQFGRDRVEIGRSPAPIRAAGAVLPLRRRA